MPKSRKLPARKPLASKDPNVSSPQHQRHQQLPPHLQELIHANHRELDRRIAAIRAVRDAEIEGMLTQLRVAKSMLSEKTLSMPVNAFVKKFCPGMEAVKTESGMIELRRINASSDCPGSTATNFEFHREQPPFVQPTPMGFPFLMSSGKDQLLRSVDGFTVNEIEDEDFLNLLNSFKDSKALHPGVVTPSMDGQLMVGVTPRTERLPKKGEPLLSVNGSPLGLFGKEGITSIAEERPRNVRRRLRASSTNEHL